MTSRSIAPVAWRSNQAVAPSNRYVLVVDDDADGRELLAEILKREELDVVTAADGREALERLDEAETLPFLILLDFTMPVMDGVTFREHQLADARLASIPTVLLSAVPNVRKEAVRLGVEAVPKPIDRQRVLALARRAALGHS